MMMGRLGIGVCAVGLLLGGCAVGDAHDEMAEALRSGGDPSPPGYPGNGDIRIYEGHTTTSEDCLIYDLLGADVHAGAADTGPIIATVVGNEIQAPNGDLLCVVEGDALVQRVRADSAQGPVLFTAFGRWIFAGDIDIDEATLPEIVGDLSDQVLFSYWGPRIVDGAAADGEVLATATKPLTHASTTRKLVVAAMIEGECGGLGLDAHP